MVFRVYVEKKSGFDVEAQQLANELRTILGIKGSEEERPSRQPMRRGRHQRSCCSLRPRRPYSANRRWTNVYADLPDFGFRCSVRRQYLPGQFDQRADSASEYIQLISGEAPDCSFRQRCMREGELSGADRRHQALCDQPGRTLGFAGMQDHVEAQVPRYRAGGGHPESFRTAGDADVSSSSPTMVWPWIWLICSSAVLTSPRNSVIRQSRKSR